jgi:hypothetical protein
VGLHSLEKGVHLGRQEIREVAERRKHDIADFLDVLFRVSCQQGDQMRLLIISP